ncbi:hypothetical protein [Streptomyces sp. NPDC047108]|uniref:hypothetical protein n=1 Tax=Streptomyces sp. NPDC047108 TaxID=3155025 RepID=UPI0033E937D4
MTHSGQGNDSQLPAARHTHEGVVLPANGGEPFVPDQQASPAAGQPWGRPWGPDSADAPAGPPAPHTSQEPLGPAAPQSHAWAPQPDAPDSAGQLPAGPGAPAPLDPPAQPVSWAQPTPPPGLAAQPGAHAQPGQQAHGRQAHGQPAQHGLPGPQAPHGAYGQHDGSGQSLPLPTGETPFPSQQAPQAQQMPPQPDAGAVSSTDATQYIPPIAGGGALPPEAPSESTTFLGHRPLQHQADGNPDAESTQYMPPVPGASGPDPQAPLPHGQPPQNPAAGGPVPPGRAPFGIRPGMPGDRQPHADFDGLFRSDTPAGPNAGTGPATNAGPPGATQHLPRFAEPPQNAQQPGAQPYATQQGNGGQGFGNQPPTPGSYEPEGRGRRRLSPLALIGIVIAGCTVAGLAAGAALSGGSDDQDDTQKTAQAGDVGDGDDGNKSSPAADPAEAQAKELDGLLADSNNSRATVIRSVEAIKSCRNLGKAAQDLRSAAGQRNSLVTRLGKISVDKLPDHRTLTSSLTSAWKASAAADNHYAAWADQVAKGRKKGCPGGKARVTGQTAAGNRASGEATTAKKQASQLWNSVAEKYSLPKRQVTQL